MAEGKRLEDRKKGHNWWFFDKTDLYNLRYPENNQNFTFNCDLRNCKIFTLGSMICKGELKYSEIDIKGIIILDSCVESKIIGGKDIYILGDCIKTDISCSGKVVILGDMDSGSLSCKEFVVMGTLKNNVPTTIEE